MKVGLSATLSSNAPVTDSAEPLPAGSSSSAAPVLPTPGEHRAVVLDIRDVRTYFFTYDGVVKALDGVSFKVREGETLGLVGETGCGKSVTAFSVTRLIPDPPGRIMGGQILYRGANLLRGIDAEAKFKPVKGSNRVSVKRHFRRIKAASDRMAAVRGGGIGMIFQEPTSAMNPIFTVANQLSESLLLHRGVEIIAEFLSATPEAPEVTAATERLLEACQAGAPPEELRTRAVQLGQAANSPSLGTQAYYIARQAGQDALPAVQRELQKALHRYRLSGLQRSHLRRQHRQLELQRELFQSFIEEMRSGQFDRGARIRVRGLQRLLRIRGWHLKLPGMRRHAENPLTQELFWRSVALLEGVSIANPAQVARSYPHELSGGMIQRAMIAMALSADPDILIADEPTTALDVTIQAQILDLMHELKSRVGTSIVLITHDLAVIAEVADRVAVMYAGQIVETATSHELFRRPLHPYAQGLLASIPRVDQPEKQLTSIPGSVPNLIFPPEGCRFHPRCPYAMPICRESRPPTTEEGTDHTVACFLYKGPVAVE